ncbi:MAG TPA: SDR family oxidoreductase [Xanthobacteraceae bacterium]|nr:SDR family oxidoreductase [Xanthobacteraceae bacterium]
MEIRHDGRAAFITGGSKGIGLAIATQFAAGGGAVAIVARGREALDAAVREIEGKSGRRVTAISADVSRPEDVARAYEEAMRALGRIDVLVNNAGTSRRGPFLEISDEVWQQDFDLKLFAAVRFTRLVWPQMAERRWGRIINVLNTGAKAPRAESAPTSVTRAAGMALTKVLAGEGARHNILVNALLVGTIATDQWVQRAKREGVPIDEFLASMGKEIPLGRVGTAQEFANLACFLASEAGSYITGTAINVDGGRSPVV